MHSKLVWDDLFYVLAVGRTGSLAGAARQLGVNHSTVFRRIGQIETRLGVRLFDRRRDGYAPTTAGEAAIAFAESSEHGVLALERQLAGEDLRPRGIVRVATTDTLLPVLLGILPPFRAAYPEIRVEVVSGPQLANLTRRDADLALRATAAPEPHLIGRKLGRIAFAIYGTPDSIARAGPDAPWAACDWIGLDDTLAHTAAYRWLAAHVPAERASLVVSSMGAALIAARQGAGLALLPCYMAADAPDLSRVTPVIDDVATDLWLLVHEDLRRTMRVRVLMDAIASAIEARRPLFEGTA